MGMKTFLFLSSRPQVGKTTVIINTGTALQRSGFRVLLINLKKDDIFRNWLNLPEPPPGHSMIGATHLGPDAVAGTHLPSSDLGANYDYMLIEDDFIGAPLRTRSLKTDAVCCCFETGQENLNDLTALAEELALHNLDVNLYIPCKTLPGEWEATSSLLMALAEHIGWEKIADPLPYCEAIHDLPLLHSSLWDLPSQYRNRQEAFSSLLHHI
jgi:hypothetical protein